MLQRELDIVNDLIDASQQGKIDWYPTDIRHAYYGEYNGTPYLVGMDLVPLDESHEYYAYYVSAKNKEWEQVAYAEEDMLTFILEEEDEPIRKLLGVAAGYSNGKEAKLLVESEERQSTLQADKKRPKIFISHASSDTKFVMALVELLKQQGFTQQDIFCSSVPGYGIKLGGNIFDALLEQFQEYNLYMIFIHSPRFYTRPISLNEMGAAWALRTQYFSILTRDMSYDGMEGVVTNRDVALKVDEENAWYRTMELIRALQDYFGKEHLADEITQQHCQSFIQYVNGIIYTFLGEATKGQIWKVVVHGMVNYVSKLFGVTINVK